MNTLWYRLLIIVTLSLNMFSFFYYTWKGQTFDIELAIAVDQKNRAIYERDSIQQHSDANLVRFIWWGQHVSASYGKDQTALTPSCIYYLCRPVEQSEISVVAKWVKQEKAKMQEGLKQ